MRRRARLSPRTSRRIAEGVERLQLFCWSAFFTLAPGLIAAAVAYVWLSSWTTAAVTLGVVSALAFAYLFSGRQLPLMPRLKDRLPLPALLEESTEDHRQHA